MQIDLIDWTKDPNGVSDTDYSLALLIHILETKTQESPRTIEKIRPTINNDIQKQTINKIKDYQLYSCLEFINLTFSFKEISQQFLSQLMKIKSANISFQEVSAFEISDPVFRKPGTVMNPLGANDALKNEINSKFDDYVNESYQVYSYLVSNGVSHGDAANVFPICKLINATVRLDLRTYLYAVKKRSSPQYQGEFKETIDKTLNLVFYKYDWLEPLTESDSGGILQNIQNSIDHIYNSSAPISESDHASLLSQIDKLKGV